MLKKLCTETKWKTRKATAKLKIVLQWEHNIVPLKILSCSFQSNRDIPSCSKIKVLPSHLQNMIFSAVSSYIKERGGGISEGAQCLELLKCNLYDLRAKSPYPADKSRVILLA